MAMQNQGGLISLPLERIHAATCVNVDDPINWILHPQRDNLFCVFDTADLSTDRSNHRVLKIVNGIVVMEELDLDMLVRNASTSGMGTSTLAGRGLDAGILALARSPYIAIRYQKIPGQVQRFQMRFTNEPDYQTALSVLIHARFPVKLVGPSQSTIENAPKPQGHARQSWGSQNISQFTQRDTAFHQSSLQRPSTSGSVFQHTTQWDHTGIPTSVSTNVRPLEDASRHTPQPRRCQTSYQPALVGMNGDVRAPRALAIAPTLPQPRGNHLFSHGMPFIAPSQASYSSHQESHPPFRLPTTIPEASPTTPSQVNSQQISSIGLSHEAPISALDLQQTMSQVLPPRRELPFAKPTHSERPRLPPVRAKARSLFSKLELPELPKPTFRSASKGATTLHRPSQGDGHPERQPFEKLSEKPPLPFKLCRGSSPTLPAIPASDESESTACSAAASDVRHRGILPESYTSKSYGEPQLPSDETINRPVLTTEATSPPKQPSPQGPLQDEDLRYMDTFVQKHMHYEQTTTSNDLSRLAGLSSKERQAEIDSMICDLIHDENFYRLLEAVENSWQRIGFDLRR